jgi:chromosome segregation ATPase
MTRTPSLTYDDVARASTRLIGRGARLTIDALYDELGRRGSRSTIHKHYKTFLEEFSERGMAVIPSAIPEPLVPIIEDFWTNALLMAGQGFDEERALHEQAIDDAKVVQTDQLKRIHQLEALLDERETLLSQKSQQLATKDEVIRELEEVNTSKDSWIDELKRDKEALGERLKLEREHWSDRLDAANEDWRRHREQLEKEARDVEERNLRDQAKYDRLVDHWMIQLDDAREHISALKLQHKEDQDRLRAEAQLERKRADRFAAQQSTLEGRIETLEIELASSQGRLVEVEAVLSEAQTNLVDAVDDVARISEKWRACEQERDNLADRLSQVDRDENNDDNSPNPS